MPNWLAGHQYNSNRWGTWGLLQSTGTDSQGCMGRSLKGQVTAVAIVCDSSMYTSLVLSALHPLGRTALPF